MRLCDKVDTLNALFILADLSADTSTKSIVAFNELVSVAQVLQTLQVYT